MTAKTIMVGRLKKGLNTIQGALEESIQLFCGEKVSIYGAGRTDTGVHASGQVAHLDLDIEFIEDKKKTRQTNNGYKLLSIKKF